MVVPFIEGCFAAYRITLEREHGESREMEMSRDAIDTDAGWPSFGASLSQVGGCWARRHPHEAVPKEQIVHRIALGVESSEQRQAREITITSIGVDDGDSRLRGKVFVSVSTCFRMAFWKR